jgi:hypothetical protein
MSLKSLRKEVISAIESMRGELNALSHAIHAEPEPALQEFKAAACLMAGPERRGLPVVREAYGLATALAAVTKALALTALDLMADEGLMGRIRADFAATAAASALAVAEVSHSQPGCTCP